MDNDNNQIIVEVSRNGLEAYLTLKQEGYLDTDFSYEEVLNKIKDIIKSDIDEQIVKEIVYQKIYNDKLRIAKGQPPEDGKDGYIKYFFEDKKKITPKVNTNGTVDYRELDLINNVKKGDILAEIIPPKEGKDGIKVTGEIIPYKKGKLPYLKPGKNVKVSDDGVKLIATSDGQVRFMGDKVVVLDILNLESVDNSTGNISFNGTVKIKNNVLSGFEVKSSGDIEVSGVVEGAILQSEGNILIRKGIQGYNCGRINARGNIISNYIENSFIYCNNNLTSEAIMHSEVTCRGEINVIGRKGLIVGGVCRARTMIKAKTVGSRMATVTVIEVGSDPELKFKYEKLEKDICEITNNLDKVKKTITLLENMAKANKLDDNKKELYNNLLYTRENLEDEFANLNREYIIVKAKLSDTSSGRLKVEGTVYPGVKIVMGNNVIYIRDEMSHCTFYREGGDIKVGPY
ncbi:DUF342 domain-containing protein [Anaerosalibacter sp. Marseille-P3206]|uniref:DUF342 domain-containing protein n=1 Tax=Anaerosalibacter sp. Marseille-P3206 TaxID=1871005 RepID=UPI0013564ADF|nr:FapA family protein [Anaerosalibacter sp. Marseille-P3206]